jgi:hypothetical protein
MTPALTGAAAGALAALAYVAEIPLDKRLVGYAYDDVVLIGRPFTADRRVWLPLGVLGNCAIGAAVGFAAGGFFWRFLRGPAWLRGLLLAQGENAALFPLAILLDRYHPLIRRGEHPRVWSRPAFLQSLCRHVAFGVAFGLLFKALTRR